jgi:Holliday junction resolvasome RuvABC endonuclease subunit
VRILGIDPAINTCGFALLEHASGEQRVLDLGVWECPKEGGIPLEQRLYELGHDVLPYLRSEHPDVVIAELPTFMQHAQSYAMLWASFATISALVQSLAKPTVFVGRSTSDWRAGIGLVPEKAAMPKMPKHPKSGAGERCICIECATARKLRAKAQAEAKKRRKASSTGLAIQRFPAACLLLNDSTPEKLHEHALEALCVAMSWTDKATDGGTRRAA